MALTDNLVAYYKLDGNSNDSLGNYNGTANSVSWTGGKVGQAGSFSNASNYINLGSINLASRSFSVSFWLYNTKSMSNSFVLQQGTSRSNKGLHIGIRNTNKFTFAFWGADLDSTTSATNNIWQLWTCTYDYPTKKKVIYLNGVQDATKTGDSYTGTGDLYISRDHFGSDMHIQGLVDEIGIWNRVLSPTEVSQLYNSGAGLSYPFTTGTMIKRWNGTAWEEKPLKRYNGSEWENITIKRYNGSSWDEL